MADSMPIPKTEQSASQITRQKLDNQRIEFGDTIKSYFLVLFILTVFFALFLIALIGYGFSVGRTMDTTVLAASVQVAFGMVLGFVCVYIGLMMTWIGIDAAYAFEGDVGTGSFVLKSASPGLLFAMGGIVLVSVSLHKRIVYEESSAKLVDTQVVDPNAKRGAVNPKSPTNMIVIPAGATPSTGAQSAGDDPIPPATFSGQIQFHSGQPSTTKRENG